ncbi:MAG: Sec-independent protein translocase protein TatAd [Syntrophorhabdus sp. PtaB.Bin184]|nr:MAG: Sec-independent protein translocase protein TatAd [Syntrophorhabdus sp. PtaB.Bin184]
MFGIGLPELILIMIVALLVVGPKKLPELARSIGKALHQVKSMTDDVKQSFEEVTSEDTEAPVKEGEAQATETAGEDDAGAAGTEGAGEPFTVETGDSSEPDMIEFPASREPDEDKEVQAAGVEQNPRGDPHGQPGTGESGGYGNLRG